MERPGTPADNAGGSGQMDHNRAASHIRVFTGDALTAAPPGRGHPAVCRHPGHDHRPGIRGRGVRLRPRRPAPVPSDDGRGPVGKQTLRRRHLVRPLAVRPVRGRPGEVREGAPRHRGRTALRMGQAGKRHPGAQAPRRPGTRRSGGGWRPEGPRDPAPADPPATWPPTQPNSRAEQPPSLNPTPPPHGESPSTAEVTGPSPPPCENPRSFPALRPGEKSPPEREKEQVVHTNGANGHKHDPCEKRVNPSTFPCRLDLELCACRAKR